MTNESLRIDDLDRQIIALLIENARRSYREVGEKIGLSAPAVKRRIDRLSTAGAISRFTVIVEPHVLGWTVEAFIELFCAPRTPAAYLREALAGYPEIVAAYTVTGDADAMLHLRVTDAAHLEAALERIRAEPIVSRTRSVVVLSRLLDRS